jgi:hypothetical protein
MEDMAIEPDFEVSYLTAVMCCSSVSSGRDGSSGGFLQHRIYMVMCCYSS